MKKTYLVLVFCFCFSGYGIANAEVSAEAWLTEYEQLEKGVSKDVYENYIAGLGQGISWGNTVLEIENASVANFRKFYCPSMELGITKSQYVNIFIRYAKAHPDINHHEVGLILAYALRDTFPCNSQEAR
jgi:hypothetical protein